ncbi:hypothetical protein CEXT_376601, partial [Caerostris extrusa]
MGASTKSAKREEGDTGSRGTNTKGWPKQADYSRRAGVKFSATGTPTMGAPADYNGWGHVITRLPNTTCAPLPLCDAELLVVLASPRYNGGEGAVFHSSGSRVGGSISRKGVFGLPRACVCVCVEGHFMKIRGGAHRVLLPLWKVVRKSVVDRRRLEKQESK